MKKLGIAASLGMMFICTQSMLASGPDCAPTDRACIDRYWNNVKKQRAAEEAKKEKFKIQSGYIFSTWSGKCVDSWKGSPKPDLVFMQWECKNKTSQTWSLSKSKMNHGPYKGHYVYTISSRQNSKLHMSVKDSSKNKGAFVTQRYIDGDFSKWALEKKGNGYIIRNVGSGKCLSIAKNSKENGAKLFQWNCHGTKDQLWLFKNQL